jgi:hypothetical protein
VEVREFPNVDASRSGLMRCLVRHGLNRRPVDDKVARTARKTFKDCAPGIVQVGIKNLPPIPSHPLNPPLLPPLRRTRGERDTHARRRRDANRPGSAGMAHSAKAKVAAGNRNCHAAASIRIALDGSAPVVGARKGAGRWS